jgi:pimeloyl-ACP methyl ester carboxylesterase
LQVSSKHRAVRAFSRCTAIVQPSASGAIASRSATVEGIELHHLTAGHSPAVILRHGCRQTLRMSKPITPLLAAKFTVIVPDLPGIGDSAIPKDRLDRKTAAICRQALAESLGVEKA